VRGPYGGVEADSREAAIRVCLRHEFVELSRYCGRLSASGAMPDPVREILGSQHIGPATGHNDVRSAVYRPPRAGVSAWFDPDRISSRKPRSANK
jgi:hypothetical protein